MPSFRYVVTIEPRSLEPGKVGIPIPGALIYVSTHKSLRAAGRRLGSVISGKRRKMQVSGARYYVFDYETGKQYTRNEC